MSSKEIEMKDDVRLLIVKGCERKIFFFSLPVTPVGLMEALDDWLLPVSSAG